MLLARSPGRVFSFIAYGQNTCTSKHLSLNITHSFHLFCPKQWLFTYFSKIAVAEEDMAPPRGMATARTSMAIAGGSGESLGLIHEGERERSQCHFHLQWRQKQTTTDCGLYRPSPVENCSV